MMRVCSFIGILEDAFIIKTTATPEGRYIDFPGIPEPDTPILSQKCTDYLMEYLKKHGIEAGKSSSYEDINPYIIRTADFIGNNFQKVRDFYSALKSILNDCREFAYTLPSTDDIGTFNAIVSLARYMRSNELLAVFEYIKTPERLLKIQAAQTPEAHSFISGVWLEHYVHSKAVSILTGEYACIRNLNVTLPESEQFEVDMLICTMVTAETQAINTVPDYVITSCSLEDFPETFKKACT